MPHLDCATISLIAVTGFHEWTRHRLFTHLHQICDIGYDPVTSRDSATIQGPNMQLQPVSCYHCYLTVLWQYCTQPTETPCLLGEA